MQIRFLLIRYVLFFICGYACQITLNAQSIKVDNPCPLETITFSLDGVEPASDSISWQIDGGTPQQIDSLMATVERVQEIEVKVIWTLEGITDSLNQTFLIQEEGACECKSGIPSVFTPNSRKPDDINSTFVPIFNSHCKDRLVSYGLAIYSRWGELIYESVATKDTDGDDEIDPNDDALKWDGTKNGEAAPADTYIYVLTYELSDIMDSSIKHEPITMKGEVLLLR